VSLCQKAFSAVSAFAGLCLGGGLWYLTGGVIGFLFVKLYPKIKEPSVEILSTFIVAYLSYVAADFCNASGVLSVVTTGMIIGWYAPTLFRPDIRMSTEAVWEMVVFLLNGIVFLMIGPLGAGCAEGSLELSRFNVGRNMPDWFAL